MENKTVRTPEYWKKIERYKEFIEVETAYGSRVMIPKRFTGGWETLRLMHEHMTERGVDPLEGMEIHQEQNPIFYDLERVFYEIYEEDN